MLVQQFSAPGITESWRFSPLEVKFKFQVGLGTMTLGCMIRKPFNNGVTYTSVMQSNALAACIKTKLSKSISDKFTSF